MATTTRRATPAPLARTQPPIVAEFRPYDISMYAGSGLDAVAGRARAYFAGLEAASRLIAVSEPFSAQPTIDHVHDLIVACGPGENWRRAGLGGYRQFLEKLTQEADLRSTRYFLVAWPPPNLPPQAILSAAADSFLTEVRQRQTGLPPIWSSSYRDQGDHLAPADRGHAYMAVYTAYELLGEWDLHSLHQVLLMPFPVAVSVDIQTYSIDKAQRRMQNAHNALSNQLSQKLGGKDARSEVAFTDLQFALRCMESGERLHECRLAILIKAPSAAKLKEYGAYITNTLASKVRLRLEVGLQAECLKLFTTTPVGNVAADLRSMPILSGGAGVMFAGPVGLRSRNETGGILIGLDRTNSNPVFFELFPKVGAAGQEAAHAAILGRTGSGKTYLMQALLHRLALTGKQVIVFEPVGHFRRLAESLGIGGSYNRIAFGTSAVNPLDVIAPNKDGDTSSQITHVNRQLALLLSCGSGAAAGKSGTAGRRVFTNTELGDLDESLRGLYTPIIRRFDLTPQQMPRLEDLCERLDSIERTRWFQLAEDQRAPWRGHDLATEIRRLFVQGALSTTFNAPTNIDLSLTARAVCFDMSGVDESYLPWFYSQLLAYMTRHFRNRQRGFDIVLAIDEFGVMARDSVLADQVWRWVKTGRTYGLAVWTADQNPDSYSTAEARQIITNAPIKLIGRQEAQDVATDRELFPRLTDLHCQQLLTAQRGEFIAILNDDYYPLKIVSSSVESGFFAGT